jgi:hypothetical protein
MTPQTRILEVVNLDDLDPSILSKVLHFFNSEYPGISHKVMTEDFFRSKIMRINSHKTGFLSVAMFGAQVVGTCSAIKKEIQVEGRIVQAVEIGDTYTSKNFRADCHFRELYPDTSSINEYLNKSIFGRLASETLDRAKLDGVEFVYGVPNQQAKLSWIGKLGFELIDENSIYRVSAPSMSHPSIRSGSLRRVLYGLYQRATLSFSFLITYKYSLEHLSNTQDFQGVSFGPTLEENFESMQLRNSNDWVQRRFLKNSDKKYEFVQIRNRRSSAICGYLLFLPQTREDGFRLIVSAKMLQISQDLEKFKMPFSRIATHKFFQMDNLSLWIDSKITRKFMRLFYGFLANPVKVEIVGKNLDSNLIARKSKVRMRNFDYGDSDLG